MASLTAAERARHPRPEGLIAGPVEASADARAAGSPPWWSETWWFTFLSDDGALGGSVELAALGDGSVASYRAYLVGPGRPIVAVVDHAVPGPPDRGPRGSLELRTEGLWADHICETPIEHWTVGLEAFGLGVDDPAELYGRAYGDRVALGFDLEWERAGSATEEGAPGSTGYAVECQVSGEVLVGAEVHDLVGVGSRGHRWGSADPRRRPGHLRLWPADGDRGPDRPGGPGRAANEPVRTLAVPVDDDWSGSAHPRSARPPIVIERGGDGLPAAVRDEGPGGAGALEVTSVIAAEEPGPDGVIRTARALVAGRLDGRGVRGWVDCPPSAQR